jgi:hypothetical protein
MVGSKEGSRRTGGIFMSKESKESKVVYKRYVKEIGEWVVITPEELESLTLDDPSGNYIPSAFGNYTQLNNYILRFWRPVLGIHTSNVLITLIMYCYGEKNSAFPSIPTIAFESGNIGISTVKKAIKTLEEYGWVERILVEIEDGDNANNIYILKRLIPFIPVKDYEKFSKRWRKEHDEYIEELFRKKIIASKDVIPPYHLAAPPEEDSKQKKKKRKKKSTKSTDNLSTESTTNEKSTENVDKPVDGDVDEMWTNNEEIPPSQENPHKIGGSQENPPENDEKGGSQENPPEKGSHDMTGEGGHVRTPNKNNILKKNIYIINKYNREVAIEELNQLLHEKLKQRISKPSYDTWFSKTVLTHIYDSIAYLKTQNLFMKDWIETRYIDLIKELLDECNVEVTGIHVYLK